MAGCAQSMPSGKPELTEQAAYPVDVAMRCSIEPLAHAVHAQLRLLQALDRQIHIRRCAASQIAAASAASFLPRLPDRRYGRDEPGAIRRTV